jgi:Icc protein
MPMVISPVSRRRFLQMTLTGAAALATRGLFAAGAAGRDPDRFILLSDPHINADPSTVSRSVNMSAKLAATLKQVLALEDSDAPPAMMFVNGDCAHHVGRPDDNAQFARLLQPAVAAGLPIVCGIGNHDDRKHFAQGVDRAISRDISRSLIDTRQMLLVRSRLADWIVLDTMQDVNVTPGEVGAEQLRILARTLDTSPERRKPVLILMHHDPEFPVEGRKPVGLIDTRALLDVILPRKQVKALVFGHQHVWGHSTIEGIHFLSLPATAYTFQPTETSAWVDLQLTETSATATIQPLDPAWKVANQRIEMAWR